MMKPLLYLILFLSVGACIDPLALDGSSNSKLLVVNGRITDQQALTQLKSSIPSQ